MAFRENKIKNKNSGLDIFKRKSWIFILEFESNLNLNLKQQR